VVIIGLNGPHPLPRRHHDVTPARSAAVKEVTRAGTLVHP
jgi:ribosomal protein S10